MDELEYYELDLLLENYNLSYKNEWEIGRLISYHAIAPYLKKSSKTIQQIIPLSSDNLDNNEIHNYELTESDITKIKAISEVVTELQFEDVTFQ